MQLQTHQQPGIRYQHEGTDQDTHDLYGQQALDLGRQRAYTRSILLIESILLVQPISNTTYNETLTNKKQ